MDFLDFAWQALFILAFGASGWALCRARLRAAAHVTFESLLGRALDVYLAFLILLLMPMANVYIASHLSEQWEMPVWLQIHWAAISWGIVSSVLAYVFGFCVTAAFTTKQRGKWAVSAFGVTVLATVQFYAGWSSRPRLPPLGGPTLASDGVILQTTPYTCVPAAGANIASILGIHTTEKELVELFHTTRDGTFPAQVLYGMARLGMAGRKVPLHEGIRAIHPPAMLFVAGDTHAVVFAGMTNGLVELWNPSVGKAFVPEWRLDQFWDGHALEFTRENR